MSKDDTDGWLKTTSRLKIAKSFMAWLPDEEYEMAYAPMTTEFRIKLIKKRHRD